MAGRGKKESAAPCNRSAAAPHARCTRPRNETVGLDRLFPLASVCSFGILEGWKIGRLDGWDEESRTTTTRYFIVDAASGEVTAHALTEQAYTQDDLRGLLTERTRLVVVNFPHNPTGYVPTHAGYTSLVDIVRQSGAYLFSDEMYRFLELDRETTLPAGCDVYRKAVSLSGLSKTFGLPGLRIGWVATRDHNILEQMRLLKDYTTICSSAPSEILGIMAVRSRENIIARQMTRIRKNIEMLDDFFSKYSDCMCWNPPLGGSICFPRISLTDDTSEFCETLIRETGIMLVPSNVFQYGNHHVRIGFGREDFPEIIERFSTYIDSHLRNRS